MAEQTLAVGVDVLLQVDRVEILYVDGAQLVLACACQLFEHVPVGVVVPFATDHLRGDVEAFVDPVVANHHGHKHQVAALLLKESERFE